MNEENIVIDNTKDRILKVALELFASEGFDAVSTRRIAQEANCNIASLNYHFGTKRQLYYECLLMMEPKSKNRLEELLISPTSKECFQQSFFAFCIFVAEFALENSASIKLLINEINADTGQPVKDSFLKPLTDIFEGYLKEAQENQVISSKIETELFTKMLISIILSHKLYKSLQAYENISNEDLAHKIIGSSTSNFYIN